MKYLKKNLELLVDKLKNKSYKPKAARRVMIPKENGKLRPLSIYFYEDKLIQEAVGHLINKELLKVCHGKMDKDKVVSVSSLS